MNAPILSRFDICEAADAAARDEVYRFRYRIYVEQMGRRQKYADHQRRMIVEPLDETATIYAAYHNGALVGTIRGNRFSDPHTDYYRRLYKVDARFPFEAHEMSLTTKLMVEPQLQRSMYPIRLIVHYARHFHYGRGCKIDFLDCNKHLIPFFQKFGYLDYRGWVVHREYGTVRPLCCPADQISRFEQLRSPLGAIARDYYSDDQFGGAALVGRLMQEAER